MIRSEELMDELIATLHFHNYFKMESANIFGGGPLNVVANNHRKENIQNYIDDLFIDYFFRNHSFKCISIPKGWKVLRYTEEGEIDTDGGFNLDLNIPYDRYTFVEWVANSLLCASGDFSKMFPNNHFISDILMYSKRFGPFWVCPRAEIKLPVGNELEGYLNDLYGMKHSKYNPIYRAQDIIDYSEFYHSNLDTNFYEGLTNYGLLEIIKRQNDYQKIKDMNLFGDYTIEDILMIYCLLVLKFKMEDYNLLSFIGLFSWYDAHHNTFLKEFRDFEYQSTDAEILKPFVRDRDLFLRFTSATKSKAVTLSNIAKGAGDIQFFNDAPVHTIINNNSLPLPFLYKELY